ncbi:palmdelphin isoform X3 [Melanotaenia boesemani]|uniref:palmdelphin isoform X3 n=1 Tax=Melanotaenia boesemani TaxID=1250792 RepID=UPI001C047EE3|nr:palmdelphin isoform X3 [Melanotaenia boesemani]
MEEADLLKERLQAITDKRRIQEDIAKKRRQIEEEKLKLQYIKKKALREQWLMDGLSQQSEEEQEAMRLQARDEQQQSDQLQSNILRIEKEVEELETQELNISAKEEVVLKRLKEVERTAEDIIKDLNAEYQADVMHPSSSAFPDIPLFFPQTQAKTRPVREPGSDAAKRATFAIEISVEHNKRTGKSQVVSTATISPETIQEKGLKVYDDGRKSVYALQSEDDQIPNGVVGEMTPTEVEELLHQATEDRVPTEVQYHPPVYSVPYTGSSRPSTPGTPTKTPRQSANSLKNGAQLLKEENQQIQDLQEQKSSQKIQAKDETPSSNLMNKNATNSAAPVSVTVRTEGMPAPMQPVYKALERHGPPSGNLTPEADVSLQSSGDFSRHRSNGSINLVSTLPEEKESESITMIFMGYENAVEEEEDGIQAELVVIGNSDDEDEGEAEGYLSYHPEGYTSKVFQPKVGLAKVTSNRDVSEDIYTNWEELVLHKPTFTHKPGKHSPHLQRPGGGESADTGSINLEKMNLCSTIR